MAQAHKWQTLSRKQLLDTPGLKVVEDTVRLPNGRQTTYVHTPSDHDSVIMIAVNAKGQVLLQREYSYPPDEIMWQLPGGAMNPGETVEAAAQRELSEESGCGARRTEVLHYFYVHNRNSDRKQYIVLCTDLYEHKLAADEDEFIESYWLDLAEVHRMIAAGECDNINLLAALNVWFHRQA